MQEAVLLAGSLGLGHEMMARGCAGLLEQSGWRTRSVDSMSLLGRRSGSAGERVFGRLVGIPGLYDGLHFAHLRTGSRLADLMARAASARLVPALEADLARQPADLLFSVFATGATAAGRLKARSPALRTVVLCTDVTVHRIWAAPGTDLFLVTSPAAAASVRRYLPRANAGRGAATGPARVLHRPIPGQGPGGARCTARGLLRAGHRQRLGLRPADRDRG